MTSKLNIIINQIELMRSELYEYGIQIGMYLGRTVNGWEELIPENIEILIEQLFALGINAEEASDGHLMFKGLDKKTVVESCSHFLNEKGWKIVVNGENFVEA